MNSFHKTKGLTLIELLIVVAIVAILGAIAYPSYQGSVQKSRRTDARAALTEIAALQEKHFFKDNAYNSDLTVVYGGTASKEGFYTLAVKTLAADTGCGADGECFELTATTTGAQASDTTCSVFTLTNTGLKEAEDSGAVDTTSICW